MSQSPSLAPVEPVKEIETEGGPDYTDNPDPRLFAYNLFGELEPLEKPKRQPRQPKAEEDKPRPTAKIQISDEQAKEIPPAI